MSIDSIIKKAIKGDEESFVFLIQARQEKIYRIAYSYVKNQQDALDVVQETVYKSFISINTLKDFKYFDTWLVRIAIHCFLDHLKKSKKFINLEEDHKNTKDDMNEIEETIE